MDLKTVFNRIFCSSSIRRIIFYSLLKPMTNEKGEKEMDTISVSSALQIAGRAGRYGTNFEHGYVTAFKPSDLPTLQYLLSQSPERIDKAGLHPTVDQIELYAYHLPKNTLSNLVVSGTPNRAEWRSDASILISSLHFRTFSYRWAPSTMNYTFCATPMTSNSWLIWYSTFPYLCVQDTYFAVRQSTAN